MPRVETVSDVKDSSSTRLLLQEGNKSYLLRRWLLEDSQSEPWNVVSREDSLSMNTSCDKETINPDELRVLAQKVYTALGGV